MSNQRDPFEKHESADYTTMSDGELALRKSQIFHAASSVARRRKTEQEARKILDAEAVTAEVPNDDDAK